MLIESNLPKCYWAEAVSTAAYLIQVADERIEQHYTGKSMDREETRPYPPSCIWL